ncbi:choline/ethanolamine kinase [Grosmannia clavigera kw1407]|uniref:ethanolamine kinase n=1 Tax=Grosmannia clavigera (strain kw1407 / UAMH 11150) TaxID=655863 RepID=F0XMG2_GROCL|nr:choline/ethanolamine kinase [Grosmannia clavigera kw1407]EFX01328.1 choline/ethanolamine kinase [Grosmannia clavigera kw1407]
MAITTTAERPVRFLGLRYDAADSDGSARRLVLALRPEWEAEALQFVRFTDGITNTLLKAVRRRQGASEQGEDEDEDQDREAILLRAYGPGTDVIIDRQREAQNHELLMRHGLAPELLARFENGMLYRFVRGAVTRPDDMRRPDVSLAIARRLAQWHAIVPCVAGEEETGQVDLPVALPDKLRPNLWTVMQKWIRALPTATDGQKQRRALLQRELATLAADLGPRPGLGRDGLVFAHTDLLSGNVIVLPPKTTTTTTTTTTPPEVTFIDYEYAVPSPAAFDIANHFAEWGGFDCDMTALPTVSQRRSFIDEYVRTYALHVTNTTTTTTSTITTPFDIPTESARLQREVDLFRGLPGFYWGIWACIQATISDIDFDYASYAETRLAEYWAWKAELDGSRVASGAEMSLRERRWAQETDDAGHL